ncbi:MAG: hypothetical protein ABI548_15275 [Polyangiaceae bacterium]
MPRPVTTAIDLIRVAVCVALIATTAHAEGGGSDELSVGSTRAPGQATSRFVASRTGVMQDLNDSVLVRLDANLTRYGGTIGSSADYVAQFVLGTTWDIKDHWSTGGTLQFSPPSSMRAEVPLTYPATPGVIAPERAKIATTNEAYGLSVSLDYDSLSDDSSVPPPRFEHALGGTLGFTEYRTSERAASARVPGAVLTRADVAGYCSAQTCPAGFSLLFDKTSQHVGQLLGSLSFTETLYHDTDLGLTGTAYDYASLPTQTNSFGLAQRGINAGDAVPIVPLRWSVRPDVSHAFGAFRASTFVQYGEYVRSSGHSVLLGAKFHYKFSSRAKVWLLANFQRDIEDTGSRFSTIVAGAGVRLWF